MPQFMTDRRMGHAGGLTMGKQYYGHIDAKSQTYIKRIKFL